MPDGVFYCWGVSFISSSAQRAGAGVTFTNMFGRRFKVSTVTFEIKPFTFSSND
jgi:hypothetical protein